MTITINGIECPIYFGIRAVKKFYQAIEKDLQADDLLEVDQVAQLVYAGIDNAAYMNRVEIPVSFADVYKDVEVMFYDSEKQKQLEVLYKSFAESQFVKTLSKGDEVKKKKSTGRK
jgi:putative lipoic acid-binding regulatory protein